MDKREKIQLIFAILASLLVGYVAGYYVISDETEKIQSELTSYKERERALDTLSAPIRGANVSSKVLDSLTAPSAGESR
ncbi:hypothetical protein HYW53_01845 [Candidatus Giovannonibacteria bacterium]|nr:hypothetical protein [Candidatus Giovannonibacteria bacterium]